MAIIGRGQITVHIAEKGEDGTSQFIHIRYSANANGNQMSVNPSTYIGIAVTNTSTAPTTYATYTWSKLAGVDGSKGVDGTSQFLHVRYSANSNGNPMVTTPSMYIGTAVTTSATAPTTYASYTWARLQGDKGEPGTSQYLHIRYSPNANGNPMQTTPAAYIGTVVTDSQTSPTTYTSYTWLRIAGMDGSKGVDGTSQFLHVRYSANANGNPMQTTVGKYIGIAVTTLATAPTSYTSYTWAQFQGDKGDKGETGSAGTAGPGIVYRGTFSASVVYYNNSLRRDVVKNGTTYYLYNGANGVSAAWNSANWEAFGTQFTSVATDLLLAQLAYIENLGVKNLKTATTGQRVEITQANNSMAFYTATQSTPVLEIKTTSDPVYMGQGAGFQIKQPATNISIFKGILQQSSEGSGISVPVLDWGQPETIAQNCILQSYNNTQTGKYKTGLYVSTSGTQGTTANDDKLTGVFIDDGGIFIKGEYSKLRSNNVLSGITCAGTVSASGSLLRSWVISFMGGYLTATRQSAGRYRISFSNTSYLYSAHDYNVIIMPNGQNNAGRYGCTLARTSSYFDVWMADDASTNDSDFTFIVFLTSKFWSY